MEKMKHDARELITVTGVLGVEEVDFCPKYYFLNEKYGKLVLVYDANLEKNMANFLWREITAIGYLSKHSNLFVPTELIPPCPSETRAKIFKEIKKQYSKLRKGVSQFQSSLLVAI